MSARRRSAIVVIALFTGSVAAQDQAQTARVMNAVRAAMAPALPFPASDRLGSLPADGKSSAPWMIKPVQPGEMTIEVLANPLNEDHQRQATKAMAQIEQSIEAAQRRADAQYERAIAEAKRTGRSQDVDGVSLDDEGLAGARIDAESHVSIQVGVAGTPSRAVTITTTPSSVHRDDAGIERFREAQATVSAGPLVITLRGNETLIADLLKKSDWASLLELLK
jgi:hypothetical protein